MEIRPLIAVLLIGFFYPLWLVTGLIDYLCHRRSDIAKTSGSTESWLHVAQFASLGLALSLAALLAITPLAFTLLAGLVVVHTILSFMDVSYTDGRRYISPLEQHAHGFMDVLPIVGVCLIGVLNWNELQAAPWTLGWKQPPIPKLQCVALIGSYFILAGVPIFEELLRTLTSKVESPPLFDNRPKAKEARRSD
ncbi:MAG TPA: hypothetical protein VNQ14_13980 [Woeseiaceae bacterium]|nr:hypothetical protein [Woeseiaceae bacterium]